MLVPRPGSRWQLDAAAFRSAAARDWPGAELSAEIVMGSGNTGVMLSTPVGDGRPLSCTLSVEPDGDGSFSIQSGTGIEAAAMFAWFRAWLGPGQPAGILTTSGDGTTAEVPAGAGAGDVLAIIDSLRP